MTFGKIGNTLVKLLFSNLSFVRSIRGLRQEEEKFTGKVTVRSGIRTHAYKSRLRPERSALDRSAILTPISKCHCFTINSYSKGVTAVRYGQWHVF